jgi:hypothetical protein
MVEGGKVSKRIFQFLPYDPLQYFLSPRRHPWVKYQTLVRILGKPRNDAEVLAWQERRDASKVVQGVRARQAEDGSFRCMPWIHVHKYYFHQLLEMGYDLEDDTVRRSADNLLDYQLPGGAYRHPGAKMVEPSKCGGSWAPCVTGYVTMALMNLGLKDDPRVAAALQVMYEGQRENGGWICEHIGRRHPYCIISGTPWVFACLSHGGLIDEEHPITQRALAVFGHHKDRIVRHGYQRDHYYRCDEALLIPALCTVGLTRDHPLLADLYAALVVKQQPGGYWPYDGRPSPWYTLEAVWALSFQG